MSPKKIMMLGGNCVQMTAIKAAKEQGYHVITVDYIPDNPGHRLADEYYNISTIDKDAILNLAQSLRIDGIVSYASDVSAPTAAYVAEKMGLPTNPYNSVEILTHKNLFRTFMYEYGFPLPKGASFKNKEDALSFFESLKGVAIMKPIDSSGSKGVFKCYTSADLLLHWDETIDYSISKEIIVEEFIDRVGYQIDGDIFMADGKIIFWGICDQHHDEQLAPYVPIGLSFPSIQNKKYQEEACIQLKKIFKLLHMKIGAYNIEYIVGADNQVYILEIGPRNGGNWIPNIIKKSIDFDMAANTVRQAVGDSILAQSQNHPIKPSASYLLHAQTDGILDRIEYSDYIKSHIDDILMFVESGAEVRKFINSGNTIGMLLLTFETIDDMKETIDNMNNHIKVIVR